MNEFEKNKAPDDLITETIFLSELESVAADISFDEAQLAKIDEMLARAQQAVSTSESPDQIGYIVQDREKVALRIKEKYQKFSDLMDVQGFLDTLPDRSEPS